MGKHIDQGSRLDILHQSEFHIRTREGQRDYLERFLEPTTIQPPLYLYLSAVMDLFYMLRYFMQISRRPDSPSRVKLNSSVNSADAHCCLVQETCFLAQHKRVFSVDGSVGRTQLVV